MTSRPLEPSGEQFAAWVAEATTFLNEQVDGLATGLAYDPHGIGDLLADPALRQPPGEQPRELAELLSIVERAISKGHIGPSGGHLAYIPGSGVVSAGVADLIADVVNRYTGLADASPGTVALEMHLIRWLASIFGLPDGAGGLLTTGASMAALSALVAARHGVLGEDFADGVLDVSSHAHASIAKAARIVGFPARAVRSVGVDEAYRLDLADLDDQIAADRAAGRRPAVVVGTAGTTNLGVIDPLPELAEIARRERMWFHVDAAYGGFFQLTDRGRDRLVGIEAADSIALDAHKGLFFPFGNGCLLVRDENALRESHSGDSADYLQDLAGRDLPDFMSLSPELTRDARGLRLWLPLHLHGLAAFRGALDEKLDLAEHAYSVLSRDERLVVVGPPVLSIVGFRVRGDGGPVAGDATTRALVQALGERGRTFLSSTKVDGRDIARICILNHRTNRARVDEALVEISAHAG